MAMLMRARLPQIDSLVLWDPVVNGRRYLADLRREYDELARLYRLPVDDTLGSDQPSELFGQRWSTHLQGDLETIDLLETSDYRVRKTLLVELAGGTNTLALAERLRSLGAHCDVCNIADENVLTRKEFTPAEPYFTPVPSKILSAVGAWLTNHND